MSTPEQRTEALIRSLDALLSTFVDNKSGTAQITHMIRWINQNLDRNAIIRFINDLDGLNNSEALIDLLNEPYFNPSLDH